MAPLKPPSVNTNDFLLVFGPENTFLARAPHISRSNLNLSKDLAKTLQDAKSVSFVVCPPTAQLQPGAQIDPYISYSKRAIMGDSKLQTPNAEHCSGLTEWLKHRWSTGGLQVVTNGQGGWWGLSSSGSTASTGMPRDVRQLLKTWVHGKPTHVALGVDGTYVVLFEDGHVDWDLKGKYAALDAYLETKSQGDVAYISLSAYDGEVFFIAFADASVLYELPTGSEELDEDFLAAEGLRVIVHSDTAKHTGWPVKKAPNPMLDLAVGVLKGAVTGAVEGTTGGTLQGVVSNN